MTEQRFTFYEFFAGGGMVRAGLGPAWTCLLANDKCAKKARAYADNWGADELRVTDVGTLRPADVPGAVDLAWASFPCQDLSLAGAGAGLDGARSGAFWTFWRLMRALMEEQRGPQIIALENVCGLLSTRGGEDFAALCAALAEADLRFGAMVIDAAAFLPQSRARVFLLAVRADAPLPTSITAEGPHRASTPPALLKAHARLSDREKARWIWWRLPPPPPRLARLCDLLERAPAGVAWDEPHATRALIEAMSPIQREKLTRAQAGGDVRVGAVFRRMRMESGAPHMRVEARFDGLAGCLRTPAGGSSRQRVLFVDGDTCRSRLLTARETARLMGLPDDYRLPANRNDAYRLTGDGVAVPVIAYLKEHAFEPILDARAAARIPAARRRLTA